MGMMIADFRGEKILVTDRPTCPHCSSRRHVEGPVGFASTLEDRWPNGSRPRGRPGLVWTCLCPTLKRRVFFGVLSHEVQEVAGSGWELIDLAAVWRELEDPASC